MIKLKHLPNFITMLRIIGTVCLFWTEPLGKPFFIIYTVAGITDILDGFVARLTKTASELGAKLDSAADLLFYAAMIVRVLPEFVKVVPIPIWATVMVIVAIRLASYTTALVKFRCFASLHTYLNKLTGFAVFCAPYAYLTPYMTLYCVVVCVVAFVSSMEELFVHITRDKYRSNLKTIFEKE